MRKYKVYYTKTTFLLGLKVRRSITYTYTTMDPHMTAKRIYRAYKAVRRHEDIHIVVCAQ